MLHQKHGLNTRLLPASAKMSFPRCTRVIVRDRLRVQGLCGNWVLPRHSSTMPGLEGSSVPVPQVSLLKWLEVGTWSPLDTCFLSQCVCKTGFVHLQGPRGLEDIIATKAGKPDFSTGGVKGSYWHPLLTLPSYDLRRSFLPSSFSSSFSSSGYTQALKRRETCASRDSSVGWHESSISHFQWPRI